MSHRKTTLLFVLALAVTWTSHATAESEFDYRGYLLSRFSIFPPNRDALLYQMLEIDKHQGFLEANLDLTYSRENLTIRSDTSMLYRVAPSGCKEDSSLPGCAVINELYATYYLRDDLLVLVGRHRAAWGSALSFHPVEPMNPNPDPTDPTFQRLGAWTAMVERSWDEFVATAAWFPTITHSALGTPSGFDARSGLLGARFGWRPASFDVSGLFFHDLEANLPQFGVSGSKVIGETSFEVHGEALIHQRREVQTGAFKEGTCPVRNLGVAHRKEWDHTSLVGGRWDQGDGTMVNLEYMHNADGMVGRDFNASLNTVDLIKMMCPDAVLEPVDVAEEGRPQQLSGELLRRNYLILSGLKPTFADEGAWSNLGATASVLVGVDDFSGVVTGRLVYNLDDQTVLRFGGLAGFGSKRSQYGILPLYGLVLADVQTLF